MNATKINTKYTQTTSSNSGVFMGTPNYGAIATLATVAGKKYKVYAKSSKPLSITYYLEPSPGVYQSIASTGTSTNGIYELIFSATASTSTVSILNNGSYNFFHLDSFAVLEETVIQSLVSKVVETGGRASYRFGFNTQEKLDEIAGVGNHNTALFWEYDTRLGRRWNIDPVVKPSFSGYNSLSSNPIIMRDPNGDDDYFDPRGNYLFSTKTGNQIIIKLPTYNLLLAQVQNSKQGVSTVNNILRYYANKVGYRDKIKALSTEAGYAHTSIDGISVNMFPHLNKELSNYYNLQSALVHEKAHWDYKDYLENKYTFLKHLKVYETQIKDETFQKVDNNFRMHIGTNYLKYLLGALNAKELSFDEVKQKVVDYNKLNKDFQIVITDLSPSVPGKSLIAEHNGRNNENREVYSEVLPYLKSEQDAH